MRCARCGPVSGVPAVSEIPEIVALRRDRVFEPYPEATHLVRLDDAERELRSALDRQAREIVALARGAYADDPAVKRALDNFAVFIEGRFAPKEADPR